MYNERQKNWQRENRRYLVKHHLCRDCGKQDARTLNGYNYCYECNEKHNAYSRAYRSAHREEINERKKQRYNERKAEGKCPRCGREVDGGNKVLCDYCAANDSNRFHARYIHKRVGGVCTKCCKAPPIPGKKLCQDCYNKNMVILQTTWRKRGIIC